MSLKLRSVTKSPPIGFCYLDLQTGWRHHSWSFGATGAAWYQENVKRGTGRTREQCTRDVEVYICEQLFGRENWQQWVLVDTPPVFETIVAPPPTTTTYKTSVVIPTTGASERLNRCIKAVGDQVSEIVVVCDVPVNGFDTDKARLILTGQPDTGFGQKCNLGAKNTTGDYIWFLNDDCYVDNNQCADGLIDVLTANDTIGVVGHMLRYPNGQVQHGGTHRDPKQVGFPHLENDSVKVPTEMESVTGASMMVKRGAFQAVGGFSQEYFLYLEDTDLCLKMRQHGWKVYYTPHVKAIHETHASSSQRSDLNEIIAKSVATFTSKWSGYFNNIPTFESYDSISKTLNVAVLYVHLVGDPNHEEMATNFVNSALRFPPGQRLHWVIACNSNSGAKIGDRMRAVFDRLGTVKYFHHDNSGWDLGAYQAYCKQSTADFVVFLGSSAYCRRQNWIHPVMAAWRKHGPQAIYGTCGNLGDARVNVSPHLRTTGFWCTPDVMNRYPLRVTKPQDRYPFEHGANCLTIWAWGNGLQVLVVDAEGIYGYPNWNSGPEGYQRGSQRALLFGDRLCAPPYFHCA